jgi:hypothetical protein
MDRSLLGRWAGAPPEKNLISSMHGAPGPNREMERAGYLSGAGWMKMWLEFGRSIYWVQQIYIYITYIYITYIYLLI